MKSKAIATLGFCTTLICATAGAQPVDMMTLYTDTLDNNPRLKNAALAVEGAKAGQEKTDAGYRPQVDAGLEYGALRNDWTTLTETDSHGAQLRVQAGQNLYNPSLNAASDLAGQNTRLSEVSYQVAHDSVMLAVSQRYFSALKNQEALKQSQATLDAIEEHLTQTKHRFANGLIPENDVKEAQAQYDLALTAVIFAQNDVEKALDGLYELSGKSYSAVAPLNLSHFEPVIPSPRRASDWQEEAQVSNPKMKIQQQLVEVSRQQIELARAGHKPSLGLVAEYRYAFAGYSGLNEMGEEKSGFNKLENNSTWFAGVALTLPVYHGGAVTSEVELARNQYQQAQHLQEQTWREVSRELRSTEKDLRALQSAEKAYIQAVKSAQAALAATEQGFELGSRTIVDVLNATRQLYTARQELTESRIDFLVSALGLKYLGGELETSDIQAINSRLKQR